MSGMQVCWFFFDFYLLVYDACTANMSIAGTLDFVKVEWVADRSVKVKIKESILTFST
jgi:hypothetical protein